MDIEMLANTIFHKWKPIFIVLLIKLEYITYFISIPYAVIQFLVLRETKNKLIKLIKMCTGLFLIVPWIITSTISLLILFVYQQLVICILKLKLKSKFHGLIVGIDSVLTFYEETEQYLFTTFFIKSLKNEDAFLMSLKIRINNEILSPNTPKKINCVRKSFMGYLYFEEVDEIDADEIIKRMSLKKLTHSDFCNKMDSFFKSSTPKNNSFNWDIFWSKYDDNIEDSTFNTYVVGLRIHHALGDAMSLYNVGTNLLCEMNDAKDEYASSFNSINGLYKPFTTKIENLFELTSNPKNYLIDPIKESRGVFTFVTENGEISCLEKMKLIRKSLKGVGVLNIIATAYSAAISSYIRAKKLEGPNVPNEVLLVTPIQEKKDRFYKYYKNVFSEEVNNDFTYLAFHIPFRNDKEMDIEKRLEIVTRNIAKVYNSCDYKISYVMMKTYLELLPNTLAKLMKKVHCVGTIAMAPGGPKLKFFNGDNVINLVPFVPAIKVNGLAIAILSYANRFTFTMSANSDNFSYQELNYILNETFSNIDLLYQRFKNK